jgi:CRP/FNR family cyclic AMP-dependent transcriptional regulator
MKKSDNYLDNYRYQEIASMIGASHRMVSRIMKDLTTGGYITVKDKKITLNDRLPPRW